MIEREEREKKILEILRNSETLVSGTYLAEFFDVSRQVIVQDIAILKAKNIDIISTNRGYRLLSKGIKKIIKVKHDDSEIRKELNAIVDLGASVEDVFVTFQLQRTVQRGLAAHGRQHGIRALFFDNFTYHFPVNRLDVGRISHFRVGHDGRRVGVHQNNAVALFTQGFTGLRAGVVKLTRLTDNNRARAQNQDTFYVCTFWHCSFTPDYFAD